MSREIEERTEDARSAFLKNQISEALDEGKNMWKELRHLGLIPKSKEALQGFRSRELNSLFANASVSPLEDAVDVNDILQNASIAGFKFKTVSINAISHFPP